MSYWLLAARISRRHVLQPRVMSLFRPFSSTTSYKHESLQQLLRDFEYRNSDKVKGDFSVLLKEYPAPICTVEEYHRILSSLARSEDATDFLDWIICQRNEEIGIEITMETHLTIVRALLNSGRKWRRALVNWLRFMESKPPFLPPDRNLFHTILHDGFHVGLWTFWVNIVVSTMPYTGCPPTNETFKILMESAFHHAPETPLPNAFIAIMDSMKIMGLQYSPSISLFLRNAYESRNHKDFADEAIKNYEDRFLLDLSQQQKLLAIWGEEIANGGLRSDNHGFQAYLAAGGQRVSDLYPVFLQYSLLIEDLGTAQSIIGASVKPDATAYATLIQNNARHRQSSYAQKIYDTAVTSSVIPTVDMSLPLIQDLCTDPQDVSLNKALDIYDNFMEQGQKPTLPVYTHLLRGIAASRNSGYGEEIQRLLQDMDEHGIPSGSVKPYAIVFAMENASSQQAAFESHRKLKEGLSEDGYHQVLAYFSRLHHPRIPSWSMYFAIVSDMRVAGHPITPIVYIIILSRVLELVTVADDMIEEARRLTSEGKEREGTHMRDRAIYAREDLQVLTRATHDALTVDVSISPDARVFDALLEAYNAVSQYGDVLRLWDEMFLAGQYSNSTINVILKMCLESGHSSRGYSIWNQVLQAGFQLDATNWHNWIIFLCRTGKLEQAVKVICLELGSTTAVKAAERHVQILFEHIKGRRTRRKILDRIQQFQPTLYERLNPIFKNY